MLTPLEFGIYLLVVTGGGPLLILVVEFFRPRCPRGEAMTRASKHYHAVPGKPDVPCQGPCGPAPRVVAECWTCPKRGDGYPGTAFWRERLSIEYPESDSRSIAYHRAAGHDVRPVARDEVRG